MRKKILRIAIWLNGLVGISMALALLVVWITAPYQHGPYIMELATKLAIFYLTVVLILGISMLVMEIMGRRDRDVARDG